MHWIALLAGCVLLWSDLRFVFVSVNDSDWIFVVRLGVGSGLNWHVYYTVWVGLHGACLGRAGLYRFRSFQHGIDCFALSSARSSIGLRFTLHFGSRCHWRNVPAINSDLSYFSWRTHCPSVVCRGREGPLFRACALSRP